MNDEYTWISLEWFNKEQINEITELTELTKLTEITKMNKVPMNTQEEFKEAVMAHRYIVGSVDCTGSMSFSCNPRAHETKSEARFECNRLAKLTPDKLYIFVRFEGAEMLPKQPAVESI